MSDREETPPGREGPRGEENSQRDSFSTQIITDGSKSSKEFLLRLRPSGPWVLTAIQVDRKAIETRTFYPKDEKNMLAWLEGWNGERNIYFHVNPTRTALSKKAERSDIKELAWLHVDVDPRAGEDVAEEQERCRQLFDEKLPKGIPAPTCVIFSGGGYQGFWRLEKPLLIDGEEDKYEDAKLYNKQLEIVFGADNCHNVDRIMRLPGTVNLPDAKKTAKGRVATLAELVEFNENVYPLSQFTQAAAVQSAADGGFGGAGVKVSVPDDVPRLGSIDELDKWDVPDRLKVVAVQGKHPDEPKEGDNSRSAWVFDFCCNLIRCDVPDEVVYSILTDKDFGISESVLEMGANARKYALRQIERAREETQKGPPVLDPHAPMRSARTFGERIRPNLLHHNGDWLAHNGSAWLPLEDSTIRSELYLFLDNAQVCRGSDKPPAPFNPTRAKVANVEDALKGVAHRPTGEFEPPCWLSADGGPPPNEIVACRNGLLHLSSGELSEPTPDFFTRNALTFDFDKDAPPPARWHELLNEIWPGGEEISLLQEIMGYLLTPDTSQQKIFLFVGPKRSGKGTIGRVMERLVGAENTAGPTLGTLQKDFGLSALIGKQLALVSDMRLGHKTDRAAVAENLLRISGEDTLTIERKYKSAWSGRLSTRFVILTNEFPKLTDTSGALSNRMVPLIMRESFFGREDPGLTDKLLAELPGILLWAIEGWRKLKARGHFLLPEVSRSAIAELHALGSPVEAFIQDRCELSREDFTPTDEIWSAYQSWCAENDRRSGAKNQFCQDLMTAGGGAVERKKKSIDGRRRPVLVGIKLLQPKGGDQQQDEIPF